MLYNSGILWGTINAIDFELEIGFPLNDPVKLEKLSQGFAKYSKYRMKGCVIALDGWVLRTRCPTKKETKHIVSHRNRKGFWGMVVFAGCDAELRFLSVSSRFPGATNDSLAWDLSGLNNTVFKCNRLPPPYYAICDEALPCTENVLSPYGGQNLGVAKDSFNYHLSAMRQCIERAFAVLVGVWGVFWRELTCDYNKWPQIVQVCCKLHNLRIDFNDNRDDTSDGFSDLRRPEDHVAGDTSEVFMNQYYAENAGEWPQNAHSSSARRIKITSLLESNGFRRPTAVNNKA